MCVCVIIDSSFFIAIESLVDSSLNGVSAMKNPQRWFASVLQNPPRYTGDLMIYHWLALVGGSKQSQKYARQPTNNPIYSGKQKNMSIKSPTSKKTIRYMIHHMDTLDHCRWHLQTYHHDIPRFQRDAVRASMAWLVSIGSFNKHISGSTIKYD